MAFTVNLAYAVLASLYGLGMPNDEITLPLVLTGIEYNKWWEISYCVSISLTRTSIGVATLRIAVQRAHRLACWGLIVVSVTAYMAGIIWSLAHCSAAGYPWNLLRGECAGDWMIVPLTYTVMVIAAVCDAGFALVPVLVVRRLQMEARIKYTLMAVMAMGSLAAVFSTARLPWVHYMPAKLGTMCESLSPRPLLLPSPRRPPQQRKLTHEQPDENVYMPILSMAETMIGLVFGSLPAIGKMLRLFDRPGRARPSQPTDERLGTRTFGGTPFAPLPQEGSGSAWDAGMQLVPLGKGAIQMRIWSEA